jgi:hypothetical protein
MFSPSTSLKRSVLNKPFRRHPHWWAALGKSSRHHHHFRVGMSDSGSVPRNLKPSVSSRSELPFLGTNEPIVNRHKMEGKMHPNINASEKPPNNFSDAFVFLRNETRTNGNHNSQTSDRST